MVAVYVYVNKRRKSNVFNIRSFAKQEVILFVLVGSTEVNILKIIIMTIFNTKSNYFVIFNSL
jgi:hypothetical protein